MQNKSTGGAFARRLRRFRGGDGNDDGELHSKQPARGGDGDKRPVVCPKSSCLSASSCWSVGLSRCWRVLANSQQRVHHNPSLVGTTELDGTKEIAVRTRSVHSLVISKRYIPIARIILTS